MLTTTLLSAASGFKKNPIEWIVLGKDKDIIITVNNVEEKINSSKNALIIASLKE